MSGLVCRPGYFRLFCRSLTGFPKPDAFSALCSLAELVMPKPGKYLIFARRSDRRLENIKYITISFKPIIVLDAG